MQISYRYMFKNAGGNADESPDDFNDPHFQPTSENQVFHTVPGTMLTYNWVAGAVMAPFIRRNAMTPAIWNTMRHIGITKSQYAGAYIDLNRSVTSIATGVPDMEALFGGFGVGTPHAQAVGELVRLLLRRKTNMGPNLDQP